MTSSGSKSQLAYDWISQKIRTREFEPGHRLVLSNIAEEINVSVVPVREAIRQLEAEGLVTFERNVGASVTTLNREAYHELMEIVATLGARATALSAPYLDAQDLATAREINSRMRALDVVETPEEFTRLNKQFHKVLASKCPNERMLQLLHEQWDRLDYHRVSTFRYIPERAAESVNEHEMMVGLIEVGAEPDYIERVARQHRLKTAETYFKKNQGENKNHEHEQRRRQA
ncbi:GntR family transcriptional regulator [Corynebacterium phocae]|uniref:GntR family transcriptional regulator n=1 Tax=Corynebacterium phocae TaxID=161895 RepID=A0A1L7D6A8_9CORY|nr:GntR family transcriptional regulator [Corynebacterium phocae]APT93523.1 GntR family transcriptional regulator [Corynebacterium phocae]KAA8720604.1 GntR family transcriptional regulator [Corynebacterium phocae]